MVAAIFAPLEALAQRHAAAVRQARQTALEERYIRTALVLATGGLDEVMPCVVSREIRLPQGYDSFEMFLERLRCVGFAV